MCPDCDSTWTYLVCARVHVAELFYCSSSISHDCEWKTATLVSCLQTWRRSFYSPIPNIGDFITVGNLDVTREGLTTQTFPITAQVKALIAAEDLVITEFSTNITLQSPTSKATVSLNSAARISTLKDNNNDKGYIVQASINLANGNLGSPITGMLLWCSWVIWSTPHDRLLLLVACVTIVGSFYVKSMHHCMQSIVGPVGIRLQQGHLASDHLVLCSTCIVLEDSTEVFVIMCIKRPHICVSKLAYLQVSFPKFRCMRAA